MGSGPGGTEGRVKKKGEKGTEKVKGDDECSRGQEVKLCGMLEKKKRDRKCIMGNSRSAGPLGKQKRSRQKSSACKVGGIMTTTTTKGEERRVECKRASSQGSGDSGVNER